MFGSRVKDSVFWFGIEMNTMVAKMAETRRK